MSADLEELYQANVHLHKDVHTLDEKLDTLELNLQAWCTDAMNRLHRIEKLLLTLKPAAPPTAGTNLR